MLSLQKFKGVITKSVILDRTLALKFDSPVEALATSAILKEVGEQLRKTYEAVIEEGGKFRGVKVSYSPAVKYEVTDPSLEELLTEVEDAKAALSVAEKRLKLRQEELLLDGKGTEVHYNLLRVTIPK